MVSLSVITDFAHLEKGAIHIHLARFLSLIFGIFVLFFPLSLFSCQRFPCQLPFLKLFYSFEVCLDSLWFLDALIVA